MDDAYRLLERIDERTLALKEGIERIMDQVENHEAEIQLAVGNQRALLGDDYSGLRRIIREEISNSRISIREWATFVLAGLALAISAYASLAP